VTFAIVSEYYCAENCFSKNRCARRMPLATPNGGRCSRNAVIHLVMWAWSANPVSAAILHRHSEPRVMRSHAERARSSARKIDGAVSYAAANPLETVSPARPFTSAHIPILVETFLVKSASRRPGQSFRCPGEGAHFCCRAWWQVPRSLGLLPFHECQSAS
jgi:hypothetical protein